MDLSGKELLKLLKKNGWQVIRVEGSHHIVKKEEKMISVPVHGNKSIKKGSVEFYIKRCRT